MTNRPLFTPPQDPPSAEFPIVAAETAAVIARENRGAAWESAEGHAGELPRGCWAIAREIAVSLLLKALRAVSPAFHRQPLGSSPGTTPGTRPSTPIFPRIQLVACSWLAGSQSKSSVVL